MPLKICTVWTARVCVSPRLRTMHTTVHTTVHTTAHTTVGRTIPKPVAALFDQSSRNGRVMHPTTLVGLPSQHSAATVYTLRVLTDVRRGSALSEPMAGVWVCLMGNKRNDDGDDEQFCRRPAAVLHRIPPMTSSEEAFEEINRICGMNGGPAPGADCPTSLASLGYTSGKQDMRPGKPRFLEGSVDEVSFLATDIGPISGILIGPESGRWRCDEITVTSSRSGKTERFVCRDVLGDQGKRPAAFLEPIPEGGVVYGSGEDSVVLSKNQAEALREWNMQRYSSLKSRILGTTAMLVFVGSGVTLVSIGPELAIPFSLGGTSALVYQYLLQRKVDNLVVNDPGVAVEWKRQKGEMDGEEDRSEGRLQTQRKSMKSSDVQPSSLSMTAALLLSNPTVRITLLIGGFAGSLILLHTSAAMFTSGDHSPLQLEGGIGDVTSLLQDGSGVQLEIRRLVAGLAGFLMQKVAVISVSLSPDPGAKSASKGVGGTGGHWGSERVFGDDSSEKNR